ncbi:hypothetical protein DITRI_Ditri01bG0026100 [Diplodiscus trichospermus]
MEFQIYGNLGDYLSFNAHPLQFLLISRRKAEVSNRIIMQTSHGYWEDVPSDVMGVIVERLSLSDRICMSIVSKHWAAIALQKHIPTTPQIPWLTLPHGCNKKELSFYDMSAGKIQKLKLPKRLHGMVCCASSKGWLVMAKDCPNSLLLHKLANYCHHVIHATIPWLRHVLFHQWPAPESDIFLFNPISAEVHQLPSLLTVPCYQQFLQEKRKRHNVSCFISRIELSSADVSECIVAAAFEVSDPTTIALCRPGNKQWSIFTDKTEDKNFEFVNFLFNKGTLYVISRVQQVESYNLELAGSEVKLKLIPDLHMEAEDVILDIEFMTNEFALLLKNYFYLYLVESTNGELLLIKRICDEYQSIADLNYLKTRSFYVFKLNQSSGQWHRLYNIDDQVLFISYSGSSSLSANHFAGVQRNSIYFVEDIDYGEKYACPILSRESGIFYLQDGRIERSFPSINLPLRSNVCWIIPIL